MAFFLIKRFYLLSHIMQNLCKIYVANINKKKIIYKIIKILKH